MKHYHFSLGNSTNGPIGFCAVVRAESRELAVKNLKKHVVQEVDLVWSTRSHAANDGVEYIRAYTNEDAITEADIDEEEEVER